MHKAHLAILAFLGITAFTLVSCKNKNAITGKWNMVRYTSSPGMGDSTVHTIDMSDTAYMAALMRQYLPESEQNNPLIEKAKHCYAEFRPDHSFIMYDIGLVAPLVPGIKLGKELHGAWELQGDSIVTLQNISTKNIQFKITKHTADSLVLRKGSLNNYDFFFEIRFARESH